METRYDEANKVTKIAIYLNLFLVVIKIISGLIGNSGAMIADGIHSASDMITSIGVLIGNYISSKPSDKEHNYGHEKAETLVSFLLALVLIFVAGNIVVKAIQSIANIDSVQVPTILPLIAAVISVLTNEYQYIITIKVAKKINSPALKADAWHHRSDSMSSVAAFVGIGGAILGIKVLDPIASILVAVIIAKVGIEILITSVNELMDVSLGDEEEGKLVDIALRTEGVKHIKMMRTRKSGPSAYIDLVVCVDKDLTVIQGHDIANEVEKSIIENMKFIKGITVHVEPCNNCEKKHCII